MSEIPDDIMKAANECVAQFRWNNDESWHLFVARALIEERQQCAAVAASVFPAKKTISPSPFEWAGQQIVDAILNTPHPAPTHQTSIEGEEA